MVVEIFFKSTFALDVVLKYSEIQSGKDKTIIIRELSQYLKFKKIKILFLLQ